MREISKAASLFLLGLMLSGCSMKNIEAQAYAVSMGIDLTDEGSISVSVQVPALSQSGGGGGSSGDSGSEGGGGGYTFSQAEGKTLTAALEMLNAGVPRELNLTGVKSVVVSEKLAGSERFSEVLKELALAYRVYGAAEMVVCMGEAAEFIKNQKPVIGLRLSESTAVALSHYQEYGYVPSAKAADIFYLSRSFYGDPVAILAADGAEKDKMSGNGVESYADTLPDTGEKQNRYFGSALFSEGRMVGRLTGAQTQLLSALLGNIEYFSWVIGETPVRINISGSPRVDIDLSGAVPQIDVELTINMMESEGGLEPETLRQETVRRLNELTRICQECGSDPFRYAETAARQFLTVQEWLHYDWKTRFRSAQIRYMVKVRRIEL